MMRMLRYARWFFIKDIKTHHSRLEFDAINDNLPESIISLAHFFYYTSFNQDFSGSVILSF